MNRPIYAFVRSMLFLVAGLLLLAWVASQVYEKAADQSDAAVLEVGPAEPELIGGDVMTETWEPCPCAATPDEVIECLCADENVTWDNLRGSVNEIRGKIEIVTSALTRVIEENRQLKEEKRLWTDEQLTFSCPECVAGIQESSDNRVFCPVCVKESLKSTVRSGMETYTSVDWFPYYNEDGAWHSDDPNIGTTKWYCSQGHEWTETCQHGKCSQSITE